MSHNCFEEAFAVNNGSMRLHNGTADHPRNGGRSEPLAVVVIFDWNEKPLSAFMQL